MAEAALQVADFAAHLRAQLGVEVGERLVEQQHAWLDDDRARERDALLLAARELMRHLPLVGGKSHQREHIGDGSDDLVAIEALDPQAIGKRSRTPRGAETARSSGTRIRCCVSFASTAVTSRSPMKISPALGSWKPAIIRSVVVLPQPEGPSSVISSPGATSRLTSRTAATSPFT